MVAVVIDPGTGGILDGVYTWETGQSYAQAGYAVIATAASGHMGRDEAQRLYDWERALFRDCYGRDTPFPE